MFLEDYRYAIMSGGKYKEKHLEVLPIPNNLDFTKYSSLIGLLATNGASLQQGYIWFWYYNNIFLRVSHPNKEFLYWLVKFFDSSVFPFKPELTEVASSDSLQMKSKPTQFCYILWLHWNEVGINVLPHHYAEYFSIHTLAFWAMRNEHWTGNTFTLFIGRLNSAETALFQSLIKEKLGFDSNITPKSKKLRILNPSELVKQLKPLFYSSQIYRLEKKINAF